MTLVNYFGGLSHRKGNKMSNTSLNANQNYLRLAELRLSGVKIHNPLSSEIARLEGVVVEIQSRMTETEISEYRASQVVVVAPKRTSLLR